MSRYRLVLSEVAQSAEQMAVNHKVGGSIPSLGAYATRMFIHERIGSVTAHAAIDYSYPVCVYPVLTTYGERMFVADQRYRRREILMILPSFWELAGTGSYHDPIFILPPWLNG